MGAALEKLKKLIERLREQVFHGKITIHFANGVPKKVEIIAIEDL
jgi:hypothetical protein